MEAFHGIDFAADGKKTMSYDIYLVDPETKETLQTETPHLLRGGTYALGGTTDCHLNVTYNYGKHYARVLGENGIRTIYGMTARESIPVLLKASLELGDDVDDNYWIPTEGNARNALLDLIALARLRPDGVWAGD